MIKTLFLYIVMFLALITSEACRKEHTEEGPVPQLPEYLLRSITWDDGVTAGLSYNSDSTLNKTVYTYQGASGKLVYTWTGKKLTEFHQEESLYKNLFEYDGQGRVVKMRNVPKTVAGSSEYLFEFHYNAQNRVDSLNYYTVNIAGKHLQTSTVYRYHSNGDLKEAITKSGTHTITHRFDAFSPPISFNACNYIQASLGEEYIVYNYAVMSQLDKLNKLPSKITRSVKIGAGAELVERVEEQVYTIGNHRIDRVVTTISNPLAPGNTQTREAVYSYF